MGLLTLYRLPLSQLHTLPECPMIVNTLLTKIIFSTADNNTKYVSLIVLLALLCTVVETTMVTLLCWMIMSCLFHICSHDADIQTMWSLFSPLQNQQVHHLCIWHCFCGRGCVSMVTLFLSTMWRDGQQLQLHEVIVTHVLG